MRTDDPSFGRAFREALITLLGSPGDLLRVNDQPLAYYVAAGLAAVAAVALPVFLLGSFVFKLFQRDPLVWRSSISIEDDPQHGAVMAVRLYNKLHTAMANVSIQVVARVKTQSDLPVHRNLQLKTSRGENTHESTYWPFGPPAWPFTVRVPLSQRMTAAEIAGGDKIDLQGTEVRKDHAELVVLASGVLVSTGMSFVSVKRYKLGEALRLGRFAGISVDAEVQPKKWAGWESFEENEQLFLFGYGSLVSRPSLERTLSRSLPPEALIPAVLKGMRRAWNVGGDQTTHPERTCLWRDGSVFRGVRASLGLVRDVNAECNGAVVPVTRSELQRFDQRERNYRRVDVTPSVTWPGKSRAAIVYTYVPVDEAKKRLERAVALGQAAVPARYLRLLDDAFLDLGPREHEEYHRTTPSPPCPVAEIEWRDRTT